MKVITTNRKARHEYSIIETMEAGMVLLGTEVKALREGGANLKDSYAAITDGELFLHNSHISHYTMANRFNHEPTRTRKLLMREREIKRLYGKSREKGFSLIPTRMYFKDGRVKVEIGLGKGKRAYDKRELLKQKAIEREVERSYRGTRIKI